MTKQEKKELISRISIKLCQELKKLGFNIKTGKSPKSSSVYISYDKKGYAKELIRLSDHKLINPYKSRHIDYDIHIGVKRMRSINHNQFLKIIRKKAINDFI